MVTASNAGALCEGESITLTGRGCTGTLSWSNGSTAAAIRATPYSSTSYYAYCAGTNGCKSSSYVGVGGMPKIRLETASIAPCNRPVIMASNFWYGIPLVWKRDGTVFQTPTDLQFTAKEPGTYSAEAEVSGVWASQSGTFASDELRDVAFPTPSIGFAVGRSGVIIKTTGGGSNWQTQQSGTTETLQRVQMITSSVGWAAGNNNTFLKTADGEVNWVKLKVNVGWVYDLLFVDANVGWINAGGTIYYTPDGG